MDLALLVYVINALSKLGGFLFFISVMSGVVITVSLVVNFIHARDAYDGVKDTEIKQARRGVSLKVAMWAGITFIAVSLVNILTPNEKTAYTMVAAYAAQKVAENPAVQSMNGKVITIINQKLDHYIEDEVDEAIRRAKNGNKAKKED